MMKRRCRVREVVCSVLREVALRRAICLAAFWGGLEIVLERREGGTYLRHDGWMCYGGKERWV